MELYHNATGAQLGGGFQAHFATVPDCSTLETARGYVASGLSIVPVKGDGTKAPLVEWERLQTEVANDEELRRWYRGGSRLGIAIVCGYGDVEVIDFDNADVYEQFVPIINAQAPGLLERLSIVQSPRPGYHLYYRCETVEGNQKLAEREVVDENGQTKKIALIETRGRGGFILAPGSPGCCHPTGRTYEHHSGPPLTKLPTITPAERHQLLTIARTMCELPVDEATPLSSRSSLSSTSDNRPGDEYNRTATWEEILEPHGWVKVFSNGGRTHWRRPGKHEGGTSATTGNTSRAGNDLLCVFSSNAHPFEGANGKSPCSNYSKFAAYTLLNHGGDFGAATKALGQAGYGSQAPQSCDTIANSSGNTELCRKSRRSKLRNTPPWKPFPVDALPSPLAEYVEAEARCTCVDPSFVVLPLLSALASATGHARSIAVKRGHVEPCMLWTAVVGLSGDGKSPGRKNIIRLVQDRDDEAHRNNEILSSQYERDVAKWEHDKKAAKGGDIPEKPQRPALTRYLVQSVTLEKMAQILHDSPRGVLVTHDELAGFFGGLGKYKADSKAAERAAWLSMWSCETMMQDFKTATSARVDKPYVSITGGIQPDLVFRLLGNDDVAAGMPARFLWAMPPKKLRTYTFDEVDEDLLAKLRHVFHALYALQPIVEADEWSEEVKQRPYIVKLSSAARDRWLKFHNSIEERKMITTGGLNAALAKMPAQVLRIALVFHCVMDHGGDVLDDTMRRAVILGEWFAGEAERLYARQHFDELDRELSDLLDWIGTRGRITQRELQRQGPNHLRADAESILQRALTNKLVTHHVDDTPGPGAKAVYFSLTTSDGCDTMERSPLNGELCRMIGNLTPGESNPVDKM